MDKYFNNLVAAIMLQAVKDYIDGNSAERCVILEELRSKYMECISDGQSLIVAEKLEKNIDEITLRMKIYAEAV